MITYLNRWTQPDPIIQDPNNPQDYDRYAYVRNNPVNFIDPSGYDVDCAITDYICKKQVKVENAEDLLKRLVSQDKPVSWKELSKKDQKTLLDVGWDPMSYDQSDYVIPSIKDISGSVQDPVVWLIGLFGVGKLTPQIVRLAYQLAGPAYIYTTNSNGISLWPSPWNGRQIVNGINYSVHALEQMMPVGLGGRGIPPSVIENALNVGVQSAGSQPDTMRYTIDNVVVVWNYVENLVVTMWRTGH